MLYITPPWHLFYNWKCYLLTSITHLTTPVSDNHQPVLCIHKVLVCLVLDCTHKWDHVVFVFLWLSLLSIMPSKSIPAVGSGKIFFFSHGWITLISIYLMASQVALVVKKLSTNAGDVRDVGSIPGFRRSPGGGHDNLLQYSCLGNPMDKGAWQATVHGVGHNWSDLASMHTSILHLSIYATFSLSIHPLVDTCVC